MTNKDKICTGQMDAALSEVGKRQAKLLTDYITSEYAVSAVYTSDLIRAADTVKGIAVASGLKLHKLKSLREVDVGLWQGKTAEELQKLYPQTYKVWKEDLGAAHPDGGESVAAVQKRALKAVLNIARRHSGQTVVVGTHGVVLRSLVCHALDLPLSEMKNLSYVANASTTIMTCDGKRLNLKQTDIHDYLKEISTSMPEGF